ncbi:MAG TPA: intein-containing Rv2578c family radical SAM protein [Cryptosporangiaceae bacterium]|nr:intein-containing Rv2578c family radical SAM protein [Cryptosporangiaceae bacterium]
MRWDHMRLTAEPVEAGAALPLPLAGQGATVRTFDAPEFRGVTFYEVRAKSVLNRVPDASPVPFRWTVNPYRGCTHACSYCLAGETPILMADGTTRPLADLRVGDEIYGTERRGPYRRYVPTTVLAHWSTVKPAYRVTLEDGTSLVSSGDHRFLTERGWKHVSGTTCGAGRRPHLTTQNSLLGVGRFASTPKPDDDYRRGYLCGMVRGDANLGTYRYPSGTVHRFRLALCDVEALDRAQEYLAGLNIPTTRFPFHPGNDHRRPLTAIRTSTRAGIEAITDLVAWPTQPGDNWIRGFLAGIFDAEGSCSRQVLRFANSDGAIVAAIAAGLARLGFDHVIEHKRRNKVRTVRLRGGLRERLRFFHTVDPAVNRKREIGGVALKSDAKLRVVSVEPLGFERPLYDITTGTGDFVADGVISHNCFARKTHSYLDLDTGHDFDSRIVVKVNAGEQLARELAARSWKGEHVAMGTNTDPYQRAEGRYGLMRGILAALRDQANPFSILTKGTLILRDIDLLTEAAKVTDVRVNVSVGFLDATLWRQVESGTPNPRARLGVCRAMVDAGIGCGVLMAPVLPYLTDSDEQLEAAVAAFAEAGAEAVTPLVLHLRPGAREWYLGWLRGARPDLVTRYAALYRNSAYAPADYTRAVTARVAELARAYGIRSRTPPTSRFDPQPARPAATQLALL